LLLLSLRAATAAPDSREPEWGPLGDRLLAAFKAGDYAAIRAEEARRGASLLAESPRAEHYMAAICMARALESPASLPYYERAFLFQALPHNLSLYVDAECSRGQPRARRSLPGEDRRARG
jgi:hypothetical protein